MGGRAQGALPAQAAVLRVRVLRPAGLRVHDVVGERDELRIVDDQIGCPTCAADLADALLRMVRGLAPRSEAPWGTYHYCGSGVTSWYGMALHVLHSMRCSGRIASFRLLPIKTSEYLTPARWPPYSVLDCTRIEAAFGIRRPPWQQSIEKTVDRLLSMTDSIR